VTVSFTVKVVDGDRRIYVDRPWPTEILIATELIENGDPALIRVDGEIVKFSVNNGSATYKKTSVVGTPRLWDECWKCLLTDGATYEVAPQ
jgi:hypothetical protein